MAIVHKLELEDFPSLADVATDSRIHKATIALLHTKLFVYLLQLKIKNHTEKNQTKEYD